MKKSILVLLSIIFVFAGISIAAQETTPLKNLVLKSSYTYFPKAEYTYTMRDWKKGNETRTDLTDLTDGGRPHTRTAPGMWKMQYTVGWISKDAPVVVLFEIKEEAAVSKLTFNTVGGGGAGIMDPGIKVYGSLDNKNYVLLGETPMPTVPKNKVIYSIKKKVDLKQARVKYVAVVATLPAPFYLLFCDEIEIFGTIPANADSKLPSGKTIKGNTAQELQAAVKAVQ